MNTTKCPYCGHEDKLKYIEDKEFDRECSECGEEYEVTIEFEPIINTSKIERVECPVCSKTHRKKGTTFPIPTTFENFSVVNYKKVCYECWRKEYVKDFEKALLLSDLEAMK